MEILEKDDNIDNLVLIILARFITMGYDTTEHVDSSIDLMDEINRKNIKAGYGHCLLFHG